MTKPEEMTYLEGSASSTPDTSAESVIEDSRKNAFIKLNVKYMDGQTEINARMRAEMVDWMISRLVGHSQDTLLVAVNTMDRYLSTAVISRQTFGLVAIACVGIALEHIEDTLIPPGELAKLTEYSYTESEINLTKDLILRSLNFVIETPCHFKILRQLRNCDRNDPAFLLVELSLINYSMLKYEAFVIVQAALYLAMKLKKSEDEFGSFVGDIDTIHNCVLELLDYYFHSSYPGLSNKYKL